MGHSHAGEIIHDVSHYFKPAVPPLRLTHATNATQPIKNPTLEQIMISDHPPFAKRGDILNMADPESLPALDEAARRDDHGLKDCARHFWQALAVLTGYNVKQFVII